MSYDFKPREDEATSWLWAGLWLLAVYVSIPLARTVQEFVRDLGAAPVFGWITVAAVVAAAILIVLNLRSGRLNISPARGGFLLLIASVFLWLTWMLRANPEEAFHFVQYGIFSFLLFRALRHRWNDASVYFVCFALGMLAGTFDEIIQWIVPRRFFDLRDIGINSLAVFLVMLALAHGIQPAGIDRRTHPSGMSLFCLLAILNVMVFGFVFSNTPWLWDRYKEKIKHHQRFGETMTEYGYRIEYPGVGTFYSRLDGAALLAEDARRGAEVAPILDRHRTGNAYAMLMERVPAYTDPLLIEARARIFLRDYNNSVRKDKTASAEDIQRAINVAFHENKILEKYFSNTLSHTAYYRWGDEKTDWYKQRAKAEQPYESKIANNLITWTSQRSIMAFLIAAVVLLLLAVRCLAGRAKG